MMQLLSDRGWKSTRLIMISYLYIGSHPRGRHSSACHYTPVCSLCTCYCDKRRCPHHMELEEKKSRVTTLRAYNRHWFEAFFLSFFWSLSWPWTWIPKYCTVKWETTFPTAKSSDKQACHATWQWSQPVNLQECQKDESKCFNGPVRVSTGRDVML